jgi:hypothetical protein
MRTAVRLALLAAAFAAATRALGWWAVPVAAAAWALLDRGAMRAPWESALAAMAGWGAILLWTAATGPLGELTRRTAAILAVPPAVMITATLLYGGLLAWSGAGLMSIVPRGGGGGGDRAA